MPCVKCRPFWFKVSRSPDDFSWLLCAVWVGHEKRAQKRHPKQAERPAPNNSGSTNLLPTIDAPVRLSPRPTAQIGKILRKSHLTTALAAVEKHVISHIFHIAERPCRMQSALHGMTGACPRPAGHSRRIPCSHRQKCKPARYRKRWRSRPFSSAF